MSRRAAGALVGAAALLVLALLLLRSGDEEEGLAEPGPGAIAEVEITAGESGDLPLVQLYFPNDSGSLSAESQALEPWSSTEEGARILVEAVLVGPQSETLNAPLPEGTTLGVTHLSDSAFLYVDLVSTEHPRPPVSGSRMELTSVYSLVDSVLLNLPEVEAIVLLWNGRQLPTFAGHLDTSLPLRADADLVRRQR